MPQAPLHLLLALASLPAIAAASDKVLAPDLSRLRPGSPSVSGPQGLPRRYDPAIEPAAFQPHRDAKPISQAAPATAPAALQAKPLEINPLEAAPPQSEPRDQAEPAAQEPLPAPVSGTEETGRRLLGSSPAGAPEARRASGLPSNPLGSLAAWRPSTRTLTATGAGLAIAIGMLMSVVWLIRSLAPKSSRPLPKEVVEVLGRIPLGTKQTTQLVRVGGKLLLIAVTPEGAETLTEITDPSEVARLVAACETSYGRGQKAEFDAMLREMADQRVAPGFLGEEARGHDSLGPAAGSFDPRSLAAAYANTPGGRGDA